MSPIKEQLFSIIDCLPEVEQSLLLEIARRFLPEDLATPEDLADISQARGEFVHGQAVPHSAINWD